MAGFCSVGLMWFRFGVWSGVRSRLSGRPLDSIHDIVLWMWPATSGGTESYANGPKTSYWTCRAVLH